MSFDSREFFSRFMVALNEGDFATASAMTHPDFVADSPQSGERMRGLGVWEAQMSSYPRAEEIKAQTDDARVLSPEERWALSPAYTVVPLAGANEFTVIFRTRYPDGSWWRLISIVELREQLVYRLETYFAPELPAPLAESIASYQHG